MFSLHAPGVTVRPVQRLDGDPGFAEIFLDGLFVPDDDVIGEAGEGWRVAMSTTGSERGLSLRSPGRFLAAADRLLDLWRREDQPERSTLAGDVVDAWIGAQAYRLYTFDTVGRMLEGPVPGPESSLNKVFWSELDVALTETATRLLGPSGELVRRGRGLAGGLPVRPRRTHLRGDERDPAQRHRRASARPSEGSLMRFTLDDDQRALAGTVHDVLTGQDTATAARAWGDGHPQAGQAIWRTLAEVGVAGLLVPESFGGLGLGMVEAAGCLFEIGHHAAPGPWVESVAVAPVLLRDSVHPAAAGWLSGLATEALVVSVLLPGSGAGALDADVAGLLLRNSTGSDGGVEEVEAGSVGRRLVSVDPVRRLFELDGSSLAAGAIVAPDALASGVRNALDAGALGASAVVLGAGHAALERARDHALVRTQFDRPIGEFQAVKHLLADALGALTFARPLVHAACVALDAGAPTASRDVSAARVAADRAARRAARASLQVHGAMGYAAENDLSLFLKRIFALSSTWGPVEAHRARLTSLLAEPGQQPWMGPTEHEVGPRRVTG